MESIYLLVSKDKLKREQKLKTILQDLNEYEIIQDDYSVEELINDLETISLFNEKKVIIIDKPNFLFEFTEQEYKNFKRYTENPSENILIIQLEELSDNKMIKQLKNTSKIIQIEERNSKNIKSYIVQYFADLNIKTDDGVIETILENVNYDTIDQELEKIYLYAIDDGIILKDDLKEILTKNSDLKIYDLTKAILQRDKNMTMHIYNELISTNEDYIRIINNISYKFEELLYVKSLLNNNYQEDEVKNYFNVSSGRAYHMIKDSKQLSYELIKRNIKKLKDLDYNVKSGVISPKIGLELFLLD